MNTEQPDQLDPELSLTDIVEFFSDYGRWILIALLLGGLSVGGYQATLGQFNAKGTLTNNCNNLGGVCAVDFVAWQYLEKELPLLASQQIKNLSTASGAQPIGNEEITLEDESVSAKDPVLFGLSKPDLFKKLITPVFVLSKVDVKDLFMPGLAGLRSSTSGQLEGDPISKASTSIIGLSINMNGASAELAKTNAQQVMSFIIDGAAFLSCKGLIKSYISETETGRASNLREIAKTSIDLAYQEKWIEQLSQLASKHPKMLKEQASLIQLGNKTELMPIETQIQAAEIDVARTKDNLSRLVDRQTELAMLEQFVERSAPILEENRGGREMITHFLSIILELRSAVLPEETIKNMTLGRLESDFTSIKVRFHQGFSEGVITVSRPMIKPLLLGFGGGGLIGLMGAFGHRLMRQYRNQRSLQRVT